MKIINKTGKFTSLLLAICLITGAMPATTNCGFFSRPVKQSTLSKILTNTPNTLIKTTSVLGRFFTSNYGVRAIASSLLIAKNAAKFYNYRNDVKSGILKHMPFYLENAGLLIQSLLNYDAINVSIYGIKFLLGKNGIKSTQNYISKKIVKPIKEYFIDPATLKALEQAAQAEEQAAKEIKDKDKQDYINRIKNSKESFLYDFIFDGHRHLGIKSIAESLSIAANGASFYNKELARKALERKSFMSYFKQYVLRKKPVKAYVKSNMPFYLKNSSYLLKNVVDGDILASLPTLSKIIAGKRITRSVTEKIKRITPKILHPKLFEQDKDTAWFWQ